MDTTIVNRLRDFAAAAVLVSACIIAGCGSVVGNGSGTTQKHTLPTPTPVGLETPPANSAYLGIYVQPTASALPIQTVEAQIGRTFALDMHYYQWLATFPSGPDILDVGAGRIPVSSWNCQFTDAQVAAGDEDPLIVTRAQSVKAYGHPVFVRFFWDMNEPSTQFGRSSCADASRDSASGYFNPADYVAAWDHVRKVFASEGATNAVWVWSPSTSGIDSMPYYPGNSEVDWIGIDAFDPLDVGFSAVVGSTYAEFAALDKPILVAESGALAANQTTYLQGVAASLPAQFPLVKGFIYYDAPMTSHDWTLTPAGTSALATLGANPYFSAKGSL